MAPNPSPSGQHAPAPAGATQPYQQATDGYGLAPTPASAPAPTQAPAPASHPAEYPPVTFSGPLRAIGSYITNFFNFTKPATRSQYWWITIIFIAAPIVVFYIVYSIPLFDTTEPLSGDSTIHGIKMFLYDFISVAVALLAALITYTIGVFARLSLQARRLRDAGLSPWWVLLSLGAFADSILATVLASLGLPIITVLWLATVVVEILCLRPSKRAGNRYLYPTPAPAPDGYTSAPAPRTY